jgi:hypothetical protein
MRALRAIVLLLAMLVLAAGCASTSGGLESPGYYGRGGSIHADSFPPDYSPGRVSGWGSYGRY